MPHGSALSLSAFDTAAAAVSANHARDVCIEAAIPDTALARGGVGGILSTEEPGLQTNIDTMFLGSVTVPLPAGDRSATNVTVALAPGETIYGYVIEGMDGGIGGVNLGDILIPNIVGGAAPGYETWDASDLLDVDGHTTRPASDYHYGVINCVNSNDETNALSSVPTPICYCGNVWYPSSDLTMKSLACTNFNVVILGLAYLEARATMATPRALPAWTYDVAPNHFAVHVLKPQHGEDVMDLINSKLYPHITRSCNALFSTTNSLLQSMVPYTSFGMAPPKLVPLSVSDTAEINTPADLVDIIYDADELAEQCNRPQQGVLNPASAEDSGVNLKATMIGAVNVFPRVNDFGLAGTPFSLINSDQGSGLRGRDNGLAQWTDGVGISYLTLSLPIGTTLAFSSTIRSRVTAIVPATSGLMKRPGTYHPGFARRLQVLANLPVSATAHSFWKNIADAAGVAWDGVKNVASAVKNKAAEIARGTASAATEYASAELMAALLAVL